MKLGIVGFGRHASGVGKSVRVPKHYMPYSIYEACLMNSDLISISVCDKSIEAKVLAECLEIPFFEDVQKMITTFSPDVVAITTRSDVRFDLFEMCHKLGVNYFHLEKPLCISRHQLSALRLLSKREVKFTYGAIARHLSPYLYIKSLVDSGAFGNLRSMNINYGRSLLFWTHTHSLDLVAYFFRGIFNDPSVELFAQGSPLHEGQFSATSIKSDFLIDNVKLSRDKEVIVNITTSPGNSVELITEKGKFVIENFGQSIFFQQNSGNKTFVVWNEGMVKESEGYIRVVNLLDGAIRGNPSSIESIDIGMSDAIDSQGFAFRVADLLCGLEADDHSRTYTPLGPQGISA